jgi:hypothetical protein
MSLFGAGLKPDIATAIALASRGFSLRRLVLKKRKDAPELAF